VDSAVKEIYEDMGRIEIFQNKDSNRLSDRRASSGTVWLRTGEVVSSCIKKEWGIS
jgi:hypothetical protein